MTFKDSPFGQIPNNWQVSSISEVTNTVTDYSSNGDFASLSKNIKYKNKEDTAVLIRSVDYKNNFKGNFVFIDEHAYEFLKKSKLYGGEIIISNIGSIGKVFRCPKLPYKMSLAPNLLLIKFKECDDFYYYWLKSSIGQAMIKSLNTGSAQDKFNKTNFLNMPVPVPPLNEQKNIALILRLLEEKIEINNKTNEFLQEKALAIYKNMVIKNKDSRWTLGTLSDIATITIGQCPKSGTYGENSEGMLYFQGCAEFGFRFPPKKRYTTSPKRIAKANDTLISIRATVGNINVAYEDCSIGTGIASVCSKYNYPSFILYTMLNLRETIKSFKLEGSIFASINRETLNLLPIIIPPNEIIDKFEKVASSIDSIIRNNYDQTCYLESIYNILLPKLVSGKLDTSKISL